MARILVIDDDAQIRNLIAEVLSDAGHTVDSISDGSGAMPFFGSDGPDLVITDIVMPNQEGLETIMQLRSVNPRLPILAISGGARTGGTIDYLDVARAFGANETLSKPFSIDVLVRMVNDLLGATKRAAP